MEAKCRISPANEIVPLTRFFAKNIADIYLSNEARISREERCANLSQNELSEHLTSLTMSPRIVKCAHCDNKIHFDPKTDHITACDACFLHKYCGDSVGIAQILWSHHIKILVHGVVHDHVQQRSCERSRGKPPKRPPPSCANADHDAG